MPIYEYCCTDCRSEFSKLRPMSAADAPIECQSCHSAHTSRKLSRVAAVRYGDGGSNGGASSGGCSGCGSKNCGSCGH